MFIADSECSNGTLTIDDDGAITNNQTDDALYIYASAVTLKSEVSIDSGSGPTFFSERCSSTDSIALGGNIDGSASMALSEHEINRYQRIVIFLLMAKVA